ncbi:MAG: ChuX/HutX family heme-like substrate-binding protein [Bacteroidota bacterium]
MESTQQQSLADRWSALKTQQPQLRIRNAAQELGVTEVELLATRCGEQVVRLRPEFQAILKEVESLGKVMALSRNEDIVHERKGVYLNPSLDSAHVGLFVGEDIDLRIFFQSWGSAFAVEEMVGKEGKTRIRQSLQFFAKDGAAIHKIYLTPLSNQAAFQPLVDDFTHEDQSPQQSVEPPTELKTYAQDKEVDVAAFQAAWINLKDTHDFFGLLRKHKLDRTQALRLAPEGNYAVPVANSAMRQVLTLAAEREVPIMVFVGNQGIIQIHTGPVRKLVDYNEWFNVLDPDFNLHVKELAIAESWIVRKPTEDGVVTALEIFSSEGTHIAQFFGKRKPGIPELQGWRNIIAEIEQLNATPDV